MGFLSFLIVSAVLIILPIKFAANYVGAQRTGIFSCLIAILLVSAFQQGLKTFVPELAATHQALESIAVLLITALVYMLVLDTTYIKGFAIGVIQIVLMFVLALAFAALNLSSYLSTT